MQYITATFARRLKPFPICATTIVDKCLRSGVIFKPIAKYRAGLRAFTSLKIRESSQPRKSNGLEKIIDRRTHKML